MGDLREAIDLAVAAVVRAELTTPREIAAAARQARRRQMLDELARLESAGRGREAASIVAKKFARDPLDPVELASLAHQLRRWRNETDSVRLPPANSFTDVS